MNRVIAAGLLACLCAAPALGQSLFRQPAKPCPPAASDKEQPDAGKNDPPSADSRGHEDTRPRHDEMRENSLTMVEAPKPKTIGIHEIVFIIINETSTQTSQQTIDAKKDASLKAAVNQFPDIKMFLQGNLTNTNGGPVAAADVSGSSAFKGDGKFQRNDKFQDRIAATVIDVKPNGVLVLEARKTVGQDKEIRTLVLSGECRRDDITDTNTVLSNQLADLTILAHTEGDTKDTATKGILSRLVDAIFNF